MIILKLAFKTKIQHIWGPWYLQKCMLTTMRTKDDNEADNDDDGGDNNEDGECYKKNDNIKIESKKI